MSRPPTHWNALTILLAFSALVGCQGFSSAGKAGSQSPQQNTSPGNLSAAPASISFSSLQIGTTQNQSDTLTNNGTTALNITQMTVSGAGFSASGMNLPLTLAPGQSTPFTITFAPQSAGSLSGSVTIVSDASNPSLAVSLSGTATSSNQGPTPGQLSATPATISVGNVTVGTSGSQTGTLSATSAAVEVSSVSVESTEFAVSGISFPVTIAAGQTANFIVTFSPQSSGLASVDISFVSNASNSPASATVTGTGVAAPVYSVALSWIASTSQNIVGYNIYRRTGTTGSYSQINTALNPATTYTDTSVVDGQTYYYETTAVNSSNEESAASAAVQAVIPAL
jgi:Abnormal spindle-like microcephaly-assoc'd, ASPM-SPD-2-Hydin